MFVTQYYHGTAVGSHSWDDIISNYMGRPMSADQKDQSPLDSAEGINNKILGLKGGETFQNELSEPSTLQLIRPLRIAEGIIHIQYERT